MVRPQQLLHPQREPAALRRAATVILMRDTPEGVEVLMTRRSSRASFAPGAYVFPGGGIDEADAAAHGLAARRPTQDSVQLTAAIAAIRESFEELGVLLARNADGHPVAPEQVAALQRHAPLFDQCRARGLTLAADAVFGLAHWITDRDLPRRFDVPFLVARMPDGQQPVADEAEQFEPVWVRPGDALARHAAGSFLMIFPTIRTLERLREFRTVEAVLQACAGDRPLWTSCPRAGLLAGQEARYMEHEMPYGELALVCPDGQIVHALDWQHERPVPLLRHLARLTASNRGAMTGPGTNTYVVGDTDTGYLVIDPGPDDPAHIERLVQATGGDVRLIVCTHSHADHAPGARPLQQLCASRPPILGLAARATAGPEAAFRPDRELQDAEVLRLEGGGRTHSLRVITTPGHAANHLCLLLLEDALLFSGDHVLNGSTTVVNPPDGNMTHYLESLDRLAQVCGEHGVEFILPAHGHVIGAAGEAIARLKAHRLAREAKVAAAMQERPDGDLDTWVPLVYGDVPTRMWPMAKRSLLAHVERLRELGHG
ncbi:MBL fold metallo-hydrolase [Ramlibacter sp. AN1015]|uniref:MBL fold metallo-hydrolase n=1 Tax=Ramlibacter sp. AN1015 TaxID=3133428 RepID=UPI0030BD50CF